MNASPNRATPRGFTLIELLIVVAIIAILAAIAVPNFLEAQTRAKVSRSKTDMRTIATGLESYYVDNNSYPTGWGVSIGANPDLHSLFLLSTPISYITTGDLQDPFWPKKDDRAMWTTYQYDPMTPDGRMDSQYHRDIGFVPQGARFPWWMMIGVGPDKTSEFSYDPFDGGVGLESRVFLSDNDSAYIADVTYDPTNGTVSRGELFRVGGSQMNTAGRFLQQN